MISKTIQGPIRIALVLGAGLLALGCGRRSAEPAQQQPNDTNTPATANAPGENPANVPATSGQPNTPRQAPVAPAPRSATRRGSTQSSAGRYEQRDNRIESARDTRSAEMRNERGGFQPGEGNAPAPATERVVKTVPAGSEMVVEFLDGVSSKESHAGDPFRARVSEPIVIDGLTVVPAGAIVRGTVTEAVPLKKIGGQARLGLDFSRLELPDGTGATLHASFVDVGKNETKRDAATIGGAAAGGAILGRILSHDQANRNTVIGAVVGAGVGTAIAAHTKGQEAEISPGAHLRLKLDEPMQLTLRR